MSVRRSSGLMRDPNLLIVVADDITSVKYLGRIDGVP
jgi:hypothetical protein